MQELPHTKSKCPLTKPLARERMIAWVTNWFRASEHRLSVFWPRFILGAAGLSALLLATGILLFNVQRGFDITDESFYLLLATQPEHVLGSISHFGFVTRILYLLSSENIAIFRAAGIVIMLGGGLLFAGSLNGYWDNSGRRNSLTQFSLPTVIAVLSGTLFYYGQWWLLTPSYNWLALISVIIVGSGLLLAFAVRQTDALKSTLPPKSQVVVYAGGFLVGMGGVLGFLAKPTTGLALAAITLMWVTVHYKSRAKSAFLATAAAVAFAGLSLHAWVRFGGYSAYLQNLLTGLELSGHIDERYSLGASLTKAYEEGYEFSYLLAELPIFQALLWFSLILVTLRFTPLNRGLLAWLGYVPVGFLLFWWTALLAKAYHPGFKVASFAEGIPTLSLGSLFISLFYMLTMGAVAIQSSKASVSTAEKEYLFKTVVIVGLSLGLAFAYAFGSANNIVRQMSGAALFFAVAMYVLSWGVATDYRFKLLPNLLALLIAMTALTSVGDVYEKPYRLLAGISEQKQAVNLLGATGTLYVDTYTSEYVEGLQRQALEAGWTRGIPLLDMTGASPGALVILDARIIGRPWLLGGYPGSNRFAEIVLMASSTALLTDAWILTAPVGNRKLDEEVLGKVSLFFPDNYEIVGEMRASSRNEIQELWKPRKAEP